MYQIKEWLKQMFVYPHLRLERENYDEYWRAKRGYDMGALSDWQIERANFVVKTLEGASVSSICDIAAGEGGILSYVGKKVGATKLIGTDISDVALERIKNFGIEAIKLDIGKVEELSRIPEADYELLFEILEHVPHSELLLKSAYEKARKGVFFSFPNTGFFVHRMRLFFGRFPLQWKLFPGEHVRYWTKRDLHWWLKSLGYANYKVHYYKGVPILNQICPSWFAAAFVIFIPKQ
jgi:2-polyprenyl-3-methyl-5-hydroxy-6-metoxy-1,4-benzoquinol methylase